MELNDKELEEYNKLNSKTTKKEVAEHSIKDNMKKFNIRALIIAEGILNGICVTISPVLPLHAI